MGSGHVKGQAKHQRDRLDAVSGNTLLPRQYVKALAVQGPGAVLPRKIAIILLNQFLVHTFSTIGIYVGMAQW